MNGLPPKLIVPFVIPKSGLGRRSFKEREIANAVREETAGYEVDIQDVMELAKAQKSINDDDDWNWLNDNTIES